jgi:hypothetical protein
VISGLTLFTELGVATVMVVATVIMHACGLAVLGRLLRIEAFQEQTHHVAALSPRTLGFTLVLVLALFVLHGLEIWTYAALYLSLGAVRDLASAVYFSTTTYATIGFSDAELSMKWRLVAAIEGINGILLLGWSTAFFVAVVARLGGARAPA